MACFYLVTAHLIEEKKPSPLPIVHCPFLLVILCRSIDAQPQLWHVCFAEAIPVC